MERRNASDRDRNPNGGGGPEGPLQIPNVIPLPLPNGQELVRLPPIVEIAIVGGFGLFIYVAPSIATFVKQKTLKTRIIILKDRLRQTDLTKKLKTLNRRRKTGSIVRVIASILPSAMFAPPCRIYVPNWAQCDKTQWLLQQQNRLLLLDEFEKPDLPSENDVGDGLIEAFEIDSEVLSSVSGGGDDDDSESVSSTPEGWTQEQRRLTAKFNPTLNASPSQSDVIFARCSTPKVSPDGHCNGSHLSVPQVRRLGLDNDQTEISELKKMVEGLMLQINCLNQSLLTSRNQSVIIAQPSGTDQVILSSQPEEQQVTITVPPPPPLPAPVQGGPPPPPPPPPPPMPPMPSFENKPLVIIKKGHQNKLIQKTTQVSLSDVLKELPNAKLRRVERSPGGTPIKPQLKLPKDTACLDVRDQLAWALKKRFESMHSPACDDTDTDKENANGSGDSFEDSPISTMPIPAKRTLFPPPCSPRRRSSNGKQSENRLPLPFGQHLLKKRPSSEDNVGEGSSPAALTGSPLREHNNNN